MDMRKIKHQVKPDTSCNPLGVDELIERQREREKKGFVLIRESRNTVRVITRK